MAAPTKKFFGAGFAAGRVYAIAAGTVYPDASAVTGRDGYSLGGPISLALSLPAPTTGAHPGNDTVLQQFSFPGIDPATGTINLSRADYDTLALLANTKVYTVNDMNEFAWGTNQSGNEPDVWLTLYQSGYANGVETWATYILKCKIYAQPRQFTSRDRADMVYNLSPVIAATTIGGRALSSTNDGCTTAIMKEVQSNYRLHHAIFTGDGATTQFSFGTSLQAAGTTYTVEKNGTEITGGAITKATDKATFTAAPSSGDRIVITYPLAADAVDID